MSNLDLCRPGREQRSSDEGGSGGLRPADHSLRTGLLALRREEFGQAAASLAAAIAAEPSSADAHAYLSAALLALGRPEAARAASARALELGPAAFGPHQKAGELALRLGDPMAAATHFLAAVRASEPGSPDETAARVALGTARRQVRTAVDHRASLPRLPVRLRSPLRALHQGPGRLWRLWRFVRRPAWRPERP